MPVSLIWRSLLIKVIIIRTFAVFNVGIAGVAKQQSYTTSPFWTGFAMKRYLIFGTFLQRLLLLRRWHCYLYLNRVSFRWNVREVANVARLGLFSKLQVCVSIPVEEWFVFIMMIPDRDRWIFLIIYQIWIAVLLAFNDFFLASWLTLTFSLIGSLTQDIEVSGGQIGKFNVS